MRATVTGEIGKKTSNNCSTIRPIFTNSKLIDLPQQKKQKKHQTSQNSIPGEQAGIFPEKVLQGFNNNVQTVRLNFTINTPIDSGQQAEKCRIIRKVPNF
jgi:hypothetical protein